MKRSKAAMVKGSDNRIAIMTVQLSPLTCPHYDPKSQIKMSHPKGQNAERDPQRCVPIIFLLRNTEWGQGCGRALV
jgi:hypothetical protein